MKKRPAETRIEPLEMKHAPFIQRYASDAAVAAMTTVPHPYPENGGEEYARAEMRKREEGVSFTYAVYAGENFVGLCGAGHDGCGDHKRPELGYWIAKPFWGRGYGYAAAVAVLERVFSEQRYPFIIARSHENNPASIRILEKCGFQPEGSEMDERGVWLRYIVKRDDFKRIVQTRERSGEEKQNA